MQTGVVYIAGPYTGRDIEHRDRHIAVAKAVLRQLLLAGVPSICPHTMTAGMEVDPVLTWDDFMSNDLALLERCDAILMLPGWRDSKGATIEHDFAVTHGKLVFFRTEDAIQRLRASK